MGQMKRKMIDEMEGQAGSVLYDEDGIKHIHNGADWICVVNEHNTDFNVVLPEAPVSNEYVISAENKINALGERIDWLTDMNKRKDTRIEELKSEVDKLEQLLEATSRSNSNIKFED